MHADQPLLRCTPIAKQLNFLVNKTNDTKKRNRMKWEKKRTSDVTLIPELLRIFPFPASLYVQTKFLASVLQRIDRLLLAHEIRLKVAYSCSWTAALRLKMSGSESTSFTIIFSQEISIVDPMSIPDSLLFPIVMLHIFFVVGVGLACVCKIFGVVFDLMVRLAVASCYYFLTLLEHKVCLTLVDSSVVAVFLIWFLYHCSPCFTLTLAIATVCRNFDKTAKFHFRGNRVPDSTRTS